MKFEIVTTEDFKRDFKRLFKKYSSIIEDVENLKNELENAPQQGEPLGKDCYKIRMSISSKGQGKSGGARLITHVKVVKEKIYLIAIYDKSDMENISDKELKERLKGIK